MDFRNRISILMLCFIIGALWGARTEATGASDCKKAAQEAGLAAKQKHPPDVSAFMAEAVKLCPENLEYRRDWAAALQAHAMFYLRALGRSSIKGKDYQPKLARFDELMDQAVTQYKQVLKADPGDLKSAFGIGRIFYLQGRYQMAADVYERALQEHKGNEELLAKLGIVKEAMCKASGEFKTHEQILASFKEETDPTNRRFKKMGFANHTEVRAVVKNRQRFNDVLFETNSFAVDQDPSIRQLNEVGKALNSKGLKEKYIAVVEGHTDNRGTKEHNKLLSEQRADAVKEWLAEKYEIPRRDVLTRGFGFSRPRVPNTSKENMKKNRRVEIIFLPRP